MIVFCLDDGTKVSKKKNKEKNLTVKPIRIQIEKRNKGLKDTLKVVVMQ